MAFETYDPSQVTVTLGAIDIQGYAEGTFIEVERNEESFTIVKGTLGDITRTRMLDRSGKIKLTLMAEAPTNDFLAAMLQLDEATGSNFAPLFVKDLGGNMKCRATECWIMKQPKVERGQKSGTVQWELECADLSISAGGHA